MVSFAIMRRAKQALFWSGLAWVCGGLLGLVYFRYLCWKRLYVRRFVHFWWSMGPVILHYRWALRPSGSDEEREERVKKLHARYAPVVRRILGELRGMYTKVAQVASMVPNTLPEEYKQEFQRLQNDTSPASWLSVRRVLEEDLGAPLGQLFERFDREPLGCASLGEAHKAVWRGRTIVVKVQFPEAADNLRADFDCIEIAARMNDKSGFALGMAKKTRKQFEKELDYCQEASHLRCLHDAVAAAPEFRSKVVIPEPIPELTRNRILAMDYIPGPKLSDIIIARLRALGMNALANTVKVVLDGEVVPGEEEEEKPGGVADSVVGPATQRVLGLVAAVLGPGRALVLAGVLAELRLRCMRCRGRLAPGSSTLELKAKFQVLMQWQGYQIFFCDVFNGDPHPGNFLAVPDGRVGIIDLGQCVQFPPNTKLAFARMICALALPESPESDDLIADALISMGVRTIRMDRVFLTFTCRYILSPVRPDWLNPSYMAQMWARDAVLDQPIEVLLITRVTSLLRGLGLFLCENVDPAQAWAPWAERWLRENGEPPTTEK